MKARGHVSSVSHTNPVKNINRCGAQQLLLSFAILLSIIIGDVQGTVNSSKTVQSDGGEVEGGNLINSVQTDIRNATSEQPASPTETPKRPMKVKRQVSSGSLSELRGPHLDHTDGLFKDLQNRIQVQQAAQEQRFQLLSQLQVSSEERDKALRELEEAKKELQEKQEILNHVVSLAEKHNNLAPHKVKEIVEIQKELLEILHYLYERKRLRDELQCLKKRVEHVERKIRSIDESKNAAVQAFETEREEWLRQEALHKQRNPAGWTLLQSNEFQTMLEKREKQLITALRKMEFERAAFERELGFLKHQENLLSQKRYDLCERAKLREMMQRSAWGIKDDTPKFFQNVNGNNAGELGESQGVSRSLQMDSQAGRLQLSDVQRSEPAARYGSFDTKLQSSGGSSSILDPGLPLLNRLKQQAPLSPQSASFQQRQAVFPNIELAAAKIPGIETMNPGTSHMKDELSPEPLNMLMQNYDPGDPRGGSKQAGISPFALFNPAGGASKLPSDFLQSLQKTSAGNRGQLAQYPNNQQQQQQQQQVQELPQASLLRNNVGSEMGSFNQNFRQQQQDAQQTALLRSVAAAGIGSNPFELSNTQGGNVQSFSQQQPSLNFPAAGYSDLVARSPPLKLPNQQETLFSNTNEGLDTICDTNQQFQQPQTLQLPSQPLKNQKPGAKQWSKADLEPDPLQGMANLLQQTYNRAKRAAEGQAGAYFNPPKKKNMLEKKLPPSSVSASAMSKEKIMDVLKLIVDCLKTFEPPESKAHALKKQEALILAATNGRPAGKPSNADMKPEPV